MFRENHHSNLVVLSDGLKMCITSIHSNSLMAENELQKIITGENTTTTEQMRPMFYKNQQKYSELNFIMYAAFFLEAYINMFDYTIYSNNTNYNFENFSKLPTSQKWKNHFNNESEFIIKVRDIFDFRNFLVHSKPIRRLNSVNEVYVKGKGWLPASSISSFINNDTGLLLENISIQKIKEVKELINASINLIESKVPNFNMHYNLKINAEEQITFIDASNNKFNELYKILNKKST